MVFNRSFNAFFLCKMKFKFSFFKNLEIKAVLVYYWNFASKNTSLTQNIFETKLLIIIFFKTGYNCCQ